MRETSALWLFLGFSTSVFGQTGVTLLSTTATGAPNSGLAGIAVDSAGNLYLAVSLQNVRTQPANLVLLPGDPTRGIVLQKIAPDGGIAYSAWLSGINDLGLPKMTVNASGEVYLAGVTRSQYLLATPGAIAERVTSQRGYVLKVSAGGDRVLTTAILDVGIASAAIARISLDAAQNIVLAVSGAVLQATPGTFPATVSHAPPWGNFVVKLNAGASEVLFVARVTESDERLGDLALDSAGNLYIVGLAGGARAGPTVLRDLVSPDGGDTWSITAESALADLDGRSGSITIHPTDAAVVFQTGRGGIFRSTDGGITWIKLGAGLEPYSIRSLFIHPVTPNLMFVLVPELGMRRQYSGARTAVSRGRLSARSACSRVWFSTRWTQAMYSLTADWHRSAARTAGSPSNVSQPGLIRPPDLANTRRN